MWTLALLAFLAATPAEANLRFNHTLYGPSRTLTCTWFTNFENSRFDACRFEGKPVLAPDESASIECGPGICGAMDEAAGRLVPKKDGDIPWGTFEVRLVGRVSLSRHRSRYLGDGTRMVLVEQLLGVNKAPGE
ncbi:MAG: hypothetical protein QOE79_1137 [Sphingomonadales bacterium]|jgi:hypothetical protein|nr:hypothetical protein [Sphingomonadales bacterium]MEA3048469.1 hypothetical protein [Sphingomonadales bacterium]